MRVDICSREVIEKMNNKEFPENTVVISFYDPIPHYNGPDYQCVDYSDKTDKVFYVSLRDMDIEILSDYNLTYETYFPEVEELARFVYDAVEKVIISYVSVSTVGAEVLDVQQQFENTFIMME